MRIDPGTTEAELRSGSDEVKLGVRDIYEELAASYDNRIPGYTALDELFTATESQFVLDRISPRDGVLDLGCGTGRFTLPIARKAASVTGLDLSPAMLEQAANKAKLVGLDITVKCGDMTDLPFDDNSFDVAVSMLAIMHVPADQQQSVFREIARVLNPGGRMLVGVKNSIVERMGQVDRFATIDTTDVDRGELVFTNTGQQEDPRAPWHSFSPADLTRLTCAAGMLPTLLRGNIPISAWLPDQVLENEAVRGTVAAFESLFCDIPPFNHLGYYLLFEAVKPNPTN